MKYLYVFALVFFSIFSISFAETANITGLVFTTEQRSIAPGEISEAITIQTQNSGGASEKVDETNDVSFSSSSGTGEFLNSSGSAVSTTMAKNTSSRTFYYRDSKEGNHSITITITGRDTGKTFSATQEIKVGEGSEDDDSGNSESSNSSSASSNTSSHGNQTDLSGTKESPTFEISAGRKRLVSVNTPVNFDAIETGSKINGRSHYLWSFGDGSSIRGKSAVHTYKFPGDYNVVLNVSGEGKDIISRTEIKVVEPKIVIKEIKFGQDGYIEVENQSSEEINLGGYLLPEDTSMKYIAPDTIVKSKSKIKLPMDIPEMERVSLFYPNKEVMISYDRIPQENRENEKIVAELQTKLFYLQNELVLAQGYIGGGVDTGLQGSVLAVVSEDGAQVVSTSSESRGDQTANLIQALDNHKENQNIFSKSINFIKGIFGR